MIKTYPEMDREIVNLLDTTKPVQAYAAQRIRDLEQENARLKSLKQRIRELTFQAEMYQAMFDEADTMVRLKAENTRLREAAQNAQLRKHLEVAEKRGR